jgi:hypothetical protein
MKLRKNGRSSEENLKRHEAQDCCMKEDDANDLGKCRSDQTQWGRVESEGEGKKSVALRYLNNIDGLDDASSEHTREAAVEERLRSRPYFALRLRLVRRSHGNRP